MAIPHHLLHRRLNRPSEIGRAKGGIETHGEGARQAKGGETSACQTSGKEDQPSGKDGHPRIPQTGS